MAAVPVSAITCITAERIDFLLTICVIDTSIFVLPFASGTGWLNPSLAATVIETPTRHAAKYGKLPTAPAPGRLNPRPKLLYHALQALENRVRSRW